MKRIIKVLFSVFIVLSAMVVFVNFSVTAGEGENWKVTVVNDTRYPCKVTVCAIDPVSLKCKPYGEKRKKVSKKETMIFETGSACPCSIKGDISILGKWYEMQSVDLGTGSSRAASDCKGTAACENSVVDIKQVKFGWQANAYDWAFKKQ